MQVERTLRQQIAQHERTHAVLVQWARTMRRRPRTTVRTQGAMLLYRAAFECFARRTEDMSMLAKVEEPFVSRLLTTLDDWSYARYVEAKHRVGFFDALAAELEWAWRFKYTVSVRQWRSTTTQARQHWIVALWQVWETMRSRKQAACAAAARTARFCALEMRTMRDTHAQMQAALTNQMVVETDDEPYWLHVETSAQLQFQEEEDEAEAMLHYSSSAPL